MADRRSWTWQPEKRTRSVFDFEKFDNQFDRYTAAANKPTWRNKGPKGRCEGAMRYKKFAVACDFSFAPGAVFKSGETIPAGAILKCKAISALVPSRRQGLKLMRKARMRYPTAYLALWQHVKGGFRLTGRETGQLVIPSERQAKGAKEMTHG